MSTDFVADIAPSQGCIAKNTKSVHRKGHEGIASESERRAPGTVSDFVVVSRGPGVPVRIVGAGVSPAHQSRCRVESRVREAVGCAGRREAVRESWRPGAPAFWSAAAITAGVPAS